MTKEQKPATEEAVIKEMTLIQKLIQIQSELIAPKNQYNKFGKYNYRSGEDILEAVKPLNAKYGLLLTITDKPIVIDSWHYIEATVTLTDGSKTIEAQAYAREPDTKKGMSQEQITGSTSSYARKYALNGLYLIDDTKDADTDAYSEQTKGNGQMHQKPKQNAPAPSKTTNKGIPAKATLSQQNLIERKAKEYVKLKEKGSVKELLEFLKISDLKSITPKFATDTIAYLDAMLKKAHEDIKNEAGLAEQYKTGDK